MDSRRLVLEHAAMRERWGDRPRWCCDPTRTWFWWEYTIEQEGNRLPVKVAYPREYPAQPPEIIIDAELPPGTPHTLYGGSTPLPGLRMCWIYPMESRRRRNTWNPATDTAAMAVGAAHRWCLAFLIWLTTREWPVPDAEEGRDAR
jgi:hypothetical protein